MAEVVIRLPVKDGREARLFGDFLNRFIENGANDAEARASESDAPYLMVRSDPQADLEMKVLIFQESRAAEAFSDGWAEARQAL